LGNISLLGIVMESGTDICIIDTINRISMSDKPVTIEKSAQYGRFVSIIAVTDDNELSLKGFKYPVTDYS
ncbi:thiamine diphosphokinase, partial [[Eubacterium] rectale]|nr:thiamine diphosphokinase [Agathobacter rectalis]